MKKINKIWISLLLSVALVTGCDTDALHDLNINPQALYKINLNYLFTAAELGAASGGSSGDNRYIDWRTNINMCGHAIQHIATTSEVTGDKYVDNFETSNAPFEFIYGDQLRNIAEILKQTGPGGYDDGKKANLRQASRILRAFLFHRLTDYYGSVPYFQALQATTGGTLYPGYDPQKAIYLDLLKELDDATGKLSASNPDEGFSDGDIIYYGDIAKWKRWGYSLMLRLAMRISNVDAPTANTYVAKAIAGGVFTSNNDNVWVPMAIGPSEWTNQNGISRAFYPGDGGQNSFLSKTLIDWLKGANLASTADDDPRLMIISGGIADWTSSSWTVIDNNPLNQKGMPNGLNQTMLETLEGGPIVQYKTYSRINFLMMQDDEPYMLMNYGEVELLLAEAYERGIGVTASTATAQTHYDAGVKASMQMYTPYDASLTVSNAAVTAYLATYPYGSKNKLQMIGEQMWVNKFLNWWDGWSDWRRTGFPTLTPTNYPGNITGGVIPQRLKYPIAEVAGNPNFSAGSTKPDSYTTKVWWAGGPN